MAKTALLIDDDAHLVEILKEYLAKFGFSVVSAGTPQAGLDLLASQSFDIVILDVMLPGKDGVQVCREIRQTSDVPVLMLTARGDVADRIVGLEIGADDYLAKPFEPRELVARLEAILRRPRFIEKRITLRFGDLEILPKERTARLKGKDLSLTTMEFEILALLAGRPGEVFSRDQIMDHLRGAEYDCYARTVDVLLSRLRQKLKDDAKKPKFLKTVWGSGYTFLGGAGEKP